MVRSTAEDERPLESYLKPNSFLQWKDQVYRILSRDLIAVQVESVPALEPHTFKIVDLVDLDGEAPPVFATTLDKLREKLEKLRPSPNRSTDSNLPQSLRRKAERMVKEYKEINRLLAEKNAEWQTLPEKLSFQSRQVSGRILAKTELLPAGFFTLLQVGTQVAPSLIIAGLKLLGREALLSGDDSSDHADGTAYDHAWNGSTSTCGSSLMNPCHPKAMFQVIVGARQALHVIAMKQTRSKVVGDVAKMLNSLAQRFQRSFPLLHLTHVCQVALTNLRPGVVLRIG